MGTELPECIWWFCFLRGGGRRPKIFSLEPAHQNKKLWFAQSLCVLFFKSSCVPSSTPGRRPGGAGHTRVCSHPVRMTNFMALGIFTCLCLEKEGAVKCGQSRSALGMEAVITGLGRWLSG